MFDIQDLNRMAINSTAAEMLRSVGKEPNPDRLHCLDLVYWTLECGGGEIEKSVSETLYAMATWRPQRIMNFLDLLPGQEYKPAGWESAQTPMELASLIAKDMEDRMFVKFPWYGDLGS
jgi:hypothetical protein